MCAGISSGGRVEVRAAAEPLLELGGSTIRFCTPAPASRSASFQSRAAERRWRSRHQS